MDELWREHAAAVRTFAARRVGAAAADDVLVETFVIAMRRPRQADVTLPWLYGVARKVVANHTRGERRRRRREAAAAASVKTSPTDDLAASVQLAMARMAPLDAEALRLAAWEGLSDEEAATVLGCTPGAFRTRLSRARTRLRKTMEAMDHAD